MPVQTQTQRVDAKNTLELKATGDGMSGEYIYGAEAQLLLVANDDLEAAHGEDFGAVSYHQSSSGQYTITKGKSGTITFTGASRSDQEGIKASIKRISKKSVVFS